MPSLPSTHRITVAIPCQSFQLLNLVRVRLPGDETFQLILGLAVTKYNGDLVTAPVSLPTNLAITEVRIIRLDEQNVEISEPHLSLYLNPDTGDVLPPKELATTPSELESEQSSDEVKSSDGSV
jgi:hypothetical protein